MTRPTVVHLALTAALTACFGAPAEPAAPAASARLEPVAATYGRDAIAPAVLQGATSSEGRTGAA